ncbi:MAG: D-alanine--D-alanine ligase [Alphaproteobacteria bacterium]
MTAKKKLRVAVLMGGWSAEREVSLVSGAAVCKALGELGHHVMPIDVQRDLPGLVQALTMHVDGKPDIVFNALHGRGGEDGCIQGVLEYLGITYTHSGVRASAVAMDKPTTKRLVMAAGVRCATGQVVTRATIIAKGYPLLPPFVIKPTNEGSSVGVRVVRDGDNLGTIEEDSWIYGEEVLIETFIPGHELTVGLMGDKHDVKAMAVTELRSHNSFYDYQAKYTDGVTDHLLPAPIPADVYDYAMRQAELAYRVLGCQGVARVDFRYDDTQPGTNGVYFLEINTQPGFTTLSLLPEQAKYLGMSFADIVGWILEHPTCPA